MDKKILKKVLTTNKPIIIVGKVGDGKINQLQEFGYTTRFNLSTLDDLTDLRNVLQKDSNKVVLEEVHRMSLVVLQDFMNLLFEFADRFILVVNETDEESLDVSLTNKCIVINYSLIV